MTQILHADRNGCALHGTLKVLEAIKGVVPILHANAGCGVNARFSANAFNGAVGRHFRGAYEISSTTLFDKHVVFGGTSRLREQIKNTVKVVNGELYVVATGCVPEVVGDDIQAMVKEAQEQRFPVLGLASPGFGGNSYVGYEHAVQGLLAGISQLFDSDGDEMAAGRINPLGVVPEQDPYWEGDLLELEAVLQSVGLEANRLFGIGQDLRDWRSAYRARLSLVLSPWGLNAARYLQERHGVPYLYFGWLPVGSRDVALLLNRLGAELALDEETVENAERRFDRHTRYFLQKAASTWLQHDLQKDVAIVAPAAQAVGLARFLAGTFGHHLSVIVISDDPPEEHRAALVTAIHEEAPATAVLFSPSREAISEAILANRPDLILGSRLESEDAQSLGIPLLEVTTPLRSNLVLSRAYAGFRGALALVEDFCAVLLAARQQPARPHVAEVIAPRLWVAGGQGVMLGREVHAS